MTIKNFFGYLGLLLSVGITGSATYFLSDVTTIGTVFYSRLFVLMLGVFISGWLIGEGFGRRASFWFAFTAIILGTLSALSYEMFFGVPKGSETNSFKYMVVAFLNGLIASSFVLFGRNTSSLRLQSETEIPEEVEAFPKEEKTDSSPTLAEEIEGDFEEEIPIQEKYFSPHYELEPIIDSGEGKPPIDSEKEPIFKADFFENNADLIVERAQLEAQRIINQAEQELFKIKMEKEKLENDLKTLILTERNLLDQYKTGSN
jgi:hypothetical protein